ncbi:L-2-hydroxyglutarate oxidase [Acinetobacter rudis]|uniref:L-2-hydroxyglutarate oxidase n=1 Tax=Acinetobacter rudis TaxID=632955 RepID=A0AAW8J6T0_9GAMM|nr:L-2-hydroxyglutarate oxidase [Acinetobacter rudis]MDQ8934874.1 L-2-hydroxyglutarate oxidase [Acinetobacter rudis]MDQ8953105.1 L-2-hydroxyglutarate oxidase [Acinetobacter rudis]MDQ9017275.1 L-2-hydroxyglutarate oxidase [Acinetobacter rudis]
MNKHYAIIGGGINGLSVARQILLDFPDAKVTVFEKENKVAQHQSSHNSGVVHAGLYYEPGGLKARLCRRGAELVQQYCLENNVAYDECGKVVVALDKEELPRLDAIYKKSLANKVPDVRMLSAGEIAEVEPNCIGVSALYSPRTAIVSYGAIAEKIAEEIQSKGGTIVLGRKVSNLTEEHNKITVHFADQDHYDTTFDYVVTCAGLQSDRLAANAGDIATPKIVPFFGQYYVIDENFKSHVKGLIYPVPDPKYPFLGVHFTKRIDGQMTIGPNAFISFGRENYDGKTFNLSDIYDFLTYKGFWKFSSKNMSAALRELSTVMSQTNFVAEAAKYVPSLENVSCVPATRGIRAQAMESDGSLVDDFVIRKQGNITHIRNAPSPGATSSLAIAEYIVREVMTHK